MNMYRTLTWIILSKTVVQLIKEKKDTKDT